MHDGAAGIAPESHRIDEDMVERLQRPLKVEAVTLVGGQVVNQIKEVRINEVGTRIYHDLVVGRRAALKRGNGVGVAVIELVSVVIADRDNARRRIVSLQSLEQSGD